MAAMTPHKQAPLRPHEAAASRPLRTVRHQQNTTLWAAVATISGAGCRGCYQDACVEGPSVPPSSPARPAPCPFRYLRVLTLTHTAHLFTLPICLPCQLTQPHCRFPALAAPQAQPADAALPLIPPSPLFMPALSHATSCTALGTPSIPRSHLEEVPRSHLSPLMPAGLHASRPSALLSKAAPSSLQLWPKPFNPLPHTFKSPAWLLPMVARACTLSPLPNELLASRLATRGWPLAPFLFLSLSFPLSSCFWHPFLSPCACALLHPWQTLYPHLPLCPSAWRREEETAVPQRPPRFAVLAASCCS